MGATGNTVEIINFKLNLEEKLCHTIKNIQKEK